MEQVNVKGPVGIQSILIFGTGPFLYTCFARTEQERGEPFMQLCVFESTGTFVREATTLFRSKLSLFFSIDFNVSDSIVAWGGAFIPHFSFEKLLEGGTVCH